MEKAPRLNPRSSVIGFKKTPKVKTLIGPAPTRRPQIVANTTHQRLRNKLVIARSLIWQGSTRPMSCYPIRWRGTSFRPLRLPVDVVGSGHYQHVLAARAHRITLRADPARARHAPASARAKKSNQLWMKMRRLPPTNTDFTTP